MNDISIFDIADLVSSIIVCVPVFIFAGRLFFRKTWMISGPQIATVVGVTWFTSFLVRLLIQSTQFDVNSSYGLLIPTVVISLIIAVFFKNWLIVFNVEELTLREGIRAILTRQNIRFSETSNEILIADTNAHIEIRYLPIYSSSQIMMYGKFPFSFLAEMRIALANSQSVGINYFSFIALALGMFFLSTGLSGFLPSNGMGMNSLPVGQSLGFGEELLANTIMLVPASFMLWSVIGIVLGIRLLGRRSLLISSWWLFVPIILPSLLISFRAVFSQFAYGFDFSDSMIAVFALAFLFPFYRWFNSGYNIFDVVEEDLLACLKIVADMHNIPYTRSVSRFTLGNEKNFVAFTASDSSTATIHIDKKSFPAHKEFISDLRLELKKRPLVGFPKLGLATLLGSLAFLALWFLPSIMSIFFR